MGTYVLIHGACSGGWCWEKVVPLLKQAGHTVETPDLPGHGQDKTPLSEVTLATYTRRVCETLDVQTEPVILLGYSMGGLAITSVAEERSGKINTLVYLKAYLVQHGESLAQVISRNTDTLLEANVNKQQGYFTAKEETLHYFSRLPYLPAAFQAHAPAGDTFQRLLPQLQTPGCIASPGEPRGARGLWRLEG